MMAATMTATKRMPAITSWPSVADPKEEAKVAAEYPTLDDFSQKARQIQSMVDADRHYYLYRVWCNSWKMLEDRGYEINVKEYDIPFDVFKDKYFKIKNNKRHPDRQKLQIRIHNPKVIVTFPGRARLEPPTLPVPVAEFDGDKELCCIIIVTDMPIAEEQSIKNNLQEFYKVAYPPSVTTEVFACFDLYLNQARYDYLIRRYKKVTAEEAEELKLVKGGRKNQVKEEEENSKRAGKRLKQNINPRQIIPLSGASILARYFALKKGEFLKSSQPRHVTAALKAEYDASGAGDRETAQFVKELFRRPDDSQVIYHHFE